MTKLIRKSLLLCVIVGVILLLFFVLSAKDSYREKVALWTMSGEYPAGKGETEGYIDHVQEYNDDYWIVGNNRGLTMVGQYLLLNEFLKAHENVTDVYVIVGLDALESKIDITYGYQYVVVPYTRIGA